MVGDKGRWVPIANMRENKRSKGRERIGDVVQVVVLG